MVQDSAKVLGLAREPGSAMVKEKDSGSMCHDGLQMNGPCRNGRRRVMRQGRPRKGWSAYSSCAFIGVPWHEENHCPLKRVAGDDLPQALQTSSSG